MARLSWEGFVRKSMMVGLVRSLSRAVEDRAVTVFVMNLKAGGWVMVKQVVIESIGGLTAASVRAVRIVLSNRLH